MTKKEATVTPLPTMDGSGVLIVVQDKEYRVRPLKIRDNTEFSEDKINFGSQFFTLNDPEKSAKLEKWMNKYLFDSKGEAMTLEKAGVDDWDIVDLKEFLRNLVDISG